MSHRNVNEKQKITHSNTTAVTNEHGAVVTVGNRLRERGKVFFKRVGLPLLYALALCSLQAVTAQASETGTAAITGSFNNLIDLVKAIVSSIGALVTLWGIFEYGNAMQSNDGMMQSMGFKRIGGGLVMLLAPQLLTIFTTTGA